MVLDDRDDYIKAIQFADASDASRLEKLFADNVAVMLEKGIYAGNHRIDLNGNIV